MKTVNRFTRKLTQRLLAIAMFTPLAGVASAQGSNAARANAAQPPAAFVGAWQLTSLELPAADGSMKRVTGAKGLLVYLADGRMAVQVMPADTAGAYEAVFGRYEVNASTRALTHHVEGSNLRALVGQDIRLTYRLDGRRLIVRSADSTQKWSAVWERK
jgi:hypothetical protein